MSEGKIFVRGSNRKKAHITILKTELVFISAALVLSAFVLGFFMGRGRGGAVFEMAPLSYTEQALGLNSTGALPESGEEAGQEAVYTEKGDGADLTATPEQSGKININTADASRLISLPGIGEVLAGRIIEYREKTGGFKNIYELMDVSGIGEKTFQKLEHLICVG
jgi:competence protein ComEA